MNDNKGFSSLSSLVSKIESDEQFKRKTEEFNSKVKPEKTTKNAISDSAKDKARVTRTQSVGGSAQAGNSQESSGNFSRFLIIIAILGGIIWWVAGNNSDNKTSTKTTFKEQVTSRGEAAKKLEQKPSLEKNYPFIKPSIGRNNILTVGEMGRK